MARAAGVPPRDLLRKRARRPVQFPEVRWRGIPDRARAEAHPPPWPTSIAVAAGVAIFAAYGLPALMSLLPGSIVILSEKGINNNVNTGRGWSIRFWPWSQIAYLSTTSDTAGGRPYKVVSLHDTAGAILVTLAMSERLTVEEIEKYLSVHGKRLVSGAAPIRKGPNET